MLCASLSYMGLCTIFDIQSLWDGATIESLGDLGITPMPFNAEMGKNGFLASISRSRILKFLENINIKIKIVETGKKYSKSISKFLKFF